MEKVDVLLINPGNRDRIFQGLNTAEFTSVEPPVFAGLFATYLRNKGVSVEIYDASALGVSIKETAHVATKVFDPTLIVLVMYGAQPSASTQHMTAAGEIANAIKESRNVPILMTGGHPAALPRRTMEGENIDFVCDLEGPITIWKTLQALKVGVDDFSNIPSLWWFDKKANQIRQPVAAEPLIVDLDGAMPGIAWDLLPMRHYRSHNWHSFDHIDQRSPYASIHTSLGCTFRCSFCMINSPYGKPAYRMWNPETVMKEIDLLSEKYGVVNLKFVDEMFVLNKSHVLELCGLLAKHPHKVNIWAYARVDTVQDQFLDALKAAGVNWLCLGIESASDFVRDGALKKYSNEDIIDVVKRIRAAGIYVIGNYIFGLPDDTRERMQSTLDLALELNCEFANFYSAMAYPGSALYTQAVASGKKLPEKWEDYSQHGYGTYPLANAFCSSAEILELRDRAFMTYFTNPSYLNMIEQKFGQKVVDHIGRMVAVPLRRKLLETVGLQ